MYLLLCPRPTDSTDHELCRLEPHCFAQGLVTLVSAKFAELNTDFGELCDRVIDTILEEYDNAVQGVKGSGAVVARKRMELKRNMLRALGERCEGNALLFSCAVLSPT